MEKPKEKRLFRRPGLLLRKIVTKHNRKQIVRREEVLRIFSKAVVKPDVSWAEAFRASKIQIVYAAACRENLIFLILLSGLVVSTETFINIGHSNTVEGVIIALSLILSYGIIYGFIGFILQPIQMVYGISGVFIIVISSIVTASAMTFIAPELWSLISRDGFLDLSWFSLFSGFLEVCIISGVFVLSYNSDVLNYNRFKKMVAQKSDDFDLPPELTGRVLLLHAQDHYVEVTTDKGKHFLRMRFSEALNKVSGLDGIQTHRSYWVAKGQILNIKTSGTQTTASLKSGETIPITANRLPEVKFWINNRS